MVVQSAKSAVANANRYKSCKRGMCLMYTRTWLGIASRYPSAISAWNNAKKRRTKGTAPRGAPVFWRGGKYGHVALSVGGGRCRSTDRPRTGVVSTVTIDSISRAWGYQYVGWSADLNGVDIPYLETASASRVPAAKRRGVPLERPRWFHTTARVLNARSGPGTKYKVRRTVERGTNVYCTRKTKGWFMGRNGLWYSRRYMKSGRR